MLTTNIDVSLIIFIFGGLYEKNCFIPATVIIPYIVIRM